jgi:hypothetical protein
MDRRGISAAALVTAALLFNQVSPTGVTGQEEARSAPPAAQASQPHNWSGHSSPGVTSECAAGLQCSALVPASESGPWSASCSLLGTEGVAAPPRAAESVQLSGDTHEPDRSRLDDWCLSGTHKPAHLRFLFVTVPDPETTHLALYFDRTIEAIESAAHLHALYLSRYWLPWPEPGRAASLADTSDDLRLNSLLHSRRASQPGVMIFTGGGDELAYLFLISESPTTGINQQQFKQAAQYANALCDTLQQSICPEAPRHVVGPFFSGSTRSAIELNDYFDRQKHPVDFFSGTLSSAAETESLRAHGLRFDEAIQSDQAAVKFLLNYLASHHLTQDGRNVAILQEGETKFGGTGVRTELLKGFPELRQMTFPRELSRLRNASLDSFGRPVSANGGGVVPAEGLIWNWHDSGKGVDSVPSFSDGQEPQSQQAALLSISSTLTQQNIRYVGIVATDIFDVLFISRFLKLTAPNARLFVLDSDLLMVKTGAESRELTGTLAVTTFPLIDQSDSWVLRLAGPIPSFARSVDVLPSRIAKGIHNAVDFQLGSNSLLPKGDSKSASVPPIQSQQPLWLTIVGRTSFWPVSLQITPQASHQPEKPAPSENSKFTFDPPDSTTVILEDALLLWGVIHLAGTWLVTSPQHWLLGQFRVRSRQDRRPDAQYQTYYLVCGMLALSAMLLLVAISVAHLWVHGEVEFHWLGLLTDIGKAVVGAALFARAFWIARHHPKRFIRPRVVWYLPWILYFVTLSCWIWFNSGPGEVDLFFAQRTFYLSNGVSPLLPLEFLLLIYYAWSWVFTRKVRLSETKQVRVPALSSLGHLGDGSERCCRQLAKATDRLIFDPATARWLGWGFVAVIVLLLRPWESLRSVEGLAFDIYFNVMVLYICLLIVFVWGRYLFIWSRLRQLLRGLERTPLRRAFSRLPQDIYSWSPLWYEDSARRSFTIAARSLECFGAIVDRGGYGIDGPSRLREMTSAFSDIVVLDKADGVNRVANESQSEVRLTKRRQGDEKCRATMRLEKILRRTAEDLLDRRLRPRWARIGGSDTLDALDAKKGAAAPDDATKLIILEEEFVALRYVGLIHYESAQLKNIVVLLVVGFVLGLMAIGSYPFLGGRQFVWSLAAVFALFAVGIIASFAQMARDAVLSRLSGTDPGKLDWSFFLRVLSYGAVPLFALLASQFPSVGRSLFSWLQPALNALH